MAIIKEELDKDVPPPVGKIFIKKEEELLETPDISKENQLYIKTPTKRKIRVRKKITGFPFQCQSCDAKYQTKMAYDYHLLTHSGARPHVCHLCGKAYRGSALLRLHIMDHTGERPHVCQVCGKGYKEGRQLKKHMMNHTGERPFKCTQCEATFKCKISLESHLVIHDSTRSHECMVCNKRFRQIQSLSRHLNLHRDRRPHKCDLCGSGFAERKQLKLHMMDHTGERPFKCHLCKAGFKIENTLRKHLATHNGNHECSICLVKFCSANRLTQHKKSHKSNWETIRRQPVQRVDESLISCTTCNIPFKTKESKERHQLLHASLEKKAAATLTGALVENIGKDLVKPSRRDVGTVIEKPEVRDAGTNIDNKLGQDIGTTTFRPIRKDLGIGAVMTDGQAMRASDKRIKQLARAYIDNEIQLDEGLDIEKPNEHDIGINVGGLVELPNQPKKKGSCLKSVRITGNRKSIFNRKTSELSGEGVDSCSEGNLEEKAQNQMRMNNEMSSLLNGGVNNVFIGCPESAESTFPPNALIVNGIPPNQIGTIIFGHKVAPNAGGTIIIGNGVTSNTGPIVLGTGILPHSAIIGNGVFLGQVPNSVVAGNGIVTNSIATGNGVLTNPVVTGSGVVANQVVAAVDGVMPDSVITSDGELPQTFIPGNGEVLKNSVTTGNGVLTNSSSTGKGVLQNSIDNESGGLTTLASMNGLIPTNSVATGKVILPTSAATESGIPTSVAARSGVLPKSGASGNGVISTSAATGKGILTNTVATVKRFVPNSLAIKNGVLTTSGSTKYGVLTTSAATGNGILANSVVTRKGDLTTVAASDKQNMANSLSKGAGVLADLVPAEIGVMAKSLATERKVLPNSVVTGNKVNSTARMILKPKTMKETVVSKNIDSGVGSIPHKVGIGKRTHIKPETGELLKAEVLSPKRDSGVSLLAGKQGDSQKNELNQGRNINLGHVKRGAICRKITESSLRSQKLTHPVLPVRRVTDGKASLIRTSKYISNKIKLTGGKRLVSMKGTLRDKYSSHHVEVLKFKNAEGKRPVQTVIVGKPPDSVVDKEVPSSLAEDTRSDLFNRGKQTRADSRNGKSKSSSYAQMLKMGNTGTENLDKPKGKEKNTEASYIEEGAYPALKGRTASNVGVTGDKRTAAVVRSKKIKASVVVGKVLEGMSPVKRTSGSESVKGVFDATMVGKGTKNTSASIDSVLGDGIAGNGVPCIAQSCNGVSDTAASQKRILRALCSGKLGTEVTCTKVPKGKVGCENPVMNEIVYTKLQGWGGVLNVREEPVKPDVTMDEGLIINDSLGKHPYVSDTGASQPNTLVKEQLDQDMINLNQNESDKDVKEKESFCSEQVKVEDDNEMKLDGEEENSLMQTGKSVVLTSTSTSGGNSEHSSKRPSSANHTSVTSVVTVVAKSEENGALVSEVFENVPDAVASLKGGVASNPANLIGLVPSERGFPIILLDSTQFTQEALRTIPSTIMKASSSLNNLEMSEKEVLLDKKTVFRVDAQSNVNKSANDSCPTEASSRSPRTTEKKKEKAVKMVNVQHKNVACPKNMGNLKSRRSTEEKGIKSRTKSVSPRKAAEANTSQESLCYITIPAKTVKSSEGNGTTTKSVKQIIEVNTSQDSYLLKEMDKCSSNGKRRKGKFTKRIMELKGMLDATFDNSCDTMSVGTRTPSGKRQGKVDKTSEKEWRTGLGEDPDSPPVCMVIPSNSEGLDIGNIDCEGDSSSKMDTSQCILTKECEMRITEEWESRGKILFARLCKTKEEESLESSVAAYAIDVGNLEAKPGNDIKEETFEVNFEEFDTGSENYCVTKEPNMNSQGKSAIPIGELDVTSFTDAGKINSSSGNSSRKRKIDPHRLSSEGMTDVFKVCIKSGSPKISLVEDEELMTLHVNENENIVKEIEGKKTCLKKDSFPHNSRNLSDVQQMKLGGSISVKADVEMAHSCNGEKVENPKVDSGCNQKIDGNVCIFDINNLEVKEDESIGIEVSEDKISCVSGEEQSMCENVFLTICKSEEDLEDVSLKEEPYKIEMDLQEAKVVAEDNEIHVKEEELEEWELICW